MSLTSLGRALGLSGFNMTLQEALNEMEAERLERTNGESFFAWPVRTYAAVSTFFDTSSWSLLITIALGLLVGMYLIDAVPSLFRLRVTQWPRMCELPAGVKRNMIRGNEGKLELLISERPAVTKGGKPAVLFIHGGFGSASMWLSWMTKLHGDGASSYAGNLYALSLRGHGGSFAPGYLEMTYLSSMTTLSMDVATALQEITTLEAGMGNSQGVIIAAHSSGGGLIQHAIASGKLPVKVLSKIGGLVGIALIAAIPPFGSMGVYWNWFMSDPFMWVRTYMHFGHPRSPLASTKLVRRAFFSEQMPENEIKDFEKSMSNYESLVWPSQMMFGRYVDVDDVFVRMAAKNVLIMVSDGDKLMGVQGQRQMAREYANVLRAEDMEEKFTNVHNVRIDATGTIAGEVKEGGKYGSLQLNLIRGSGHHIMNDVKRDEAAAVFRNWLDGI